MKACCDIPYPLHRNGTSQAERMLKELIPSYVKIDEKSITDTIAFAGKYASLINYYNTDNIRDGDWQPFFTTGDTVLLAQISVKSKKSDEEIFNTLLKIYRNDPSDENVGNIIVHLFNMASEIRQWNKFPLSVINVKKQISEWIRNHLQESIRSLIRYDKNQGAIHDYSEFYSPDWNLTELVFNGLAGSSFNEKDLKELFQSFYRVQQKIVQTARATFQKVLHKNESHPPHITLFLTFLFLFRYAREHINTLTKAHLDFYYKEVLRLEKRKEIPDGVHVIFELAKNHSTRKVPEDTLLKAGKDDQGNNLFYALNEEIVVNQTTVGQIKNLFVDTEDEHKIYVADTASSSDGKGAAFSEDSEGNWKPFGSFSNPKARIGFAVSSPVLLLREGKRKITLFVNSDKDRETGIFTEVTSETNYFQTEYSAKDQWYSVNQYHAGEDMSNKSGFKVFLDNKDTPGAIKFEIYLDTEDPGIIEFDRSKLDGDFDTIYPVIKIYLNEDPNKPLHEGEKEKKYGYGIFRNLTVNNISIDIDCQGVRDLILQNDYAVFEKEKPFLPFGTEPVMGSNFYIGSEEVFSKKLDSCQIIIDWLDLPKDRDFAEHYKVYNTVDDVSINNESFKTKISYLNNKNWEELADTPENYPSLFEPPEEGTWFIYWGTSIVNYVVAMEQMISERKSEIPVSWKKSSGEVKDDSKIAGSKPDIRKMKSSAAEVSESISREIITEEKESSTISTITPGDKIKDYARYHGLLDLTEYDDTTQRGFIKLQLAGMDFRHSRYPEIYTLRAIKMAENKPSDTDDTSYIDSALPNEPYTPKIRSLYLNYTSSQNINMENSIDPDIYTKRVDKVFHIYPFGHKEIHPNISKAKPVYLFPRFVYNSVQSIGNLYIGLKNAKPLQNVSLLFQVYEGSGNPEITVPDIKWQYLRDDEWVDLTKAEFLKDTTKGLVKTGIIQFSLPGDISTDNHILNRSLHWIRASVKENIAALPDLIDIKAQAALARFEDKNNSATHLETALPADTISKLKQSDDGIKSVSQPFSSFGGKTKETDDQFYIRVSERLRHKNRAITIWDYERLVLEAFPSIHKVKCINHTYAGENKDHENAPGHVMVVVIPDLRNKNAVNLYEPKVDLGSLTDIAEFLGKLNTPFVKGSLKDKQTPAENKLQVVNPWYEQVQVSLHVKFHKGYDKGQYQKELNEAIKKFLSPWAYDVGAPVNFGSIMHKSVIVDYIEELPYVDYLTDFKVYLFDGQGDSQEVSQIKASRARSIVTTYAVKDSETKLEHEIFADL